MFYLKLLCEAADYGVYSASGGARTVKNTHLVGVINLKKVTKGSRMMCRESLLETYCYSVTVQYGHYMVTLAHRSQGIDNSQHSSYRLKKYYAITAITSTIAQHLPLKPFLYLFVP